MQTNYKMLCGGLAGIVMAVLALPASAAVQAQAADHLVISQVQIDSISGAGGTDDDFIELYNPTDFDIDLDGHRLVKRTGTGATDSLVVAWSVSTIVPSHKYYLWANSGYGGIVSAADVVTSATLAANNGVALRNGADNTGAIVDSVAWGSATNAFVENMAAPSIPESQVILRKSGNPHVSGQGNGLDTNNNSMDFIVATSAPRNWASPAEPLGGPPSPVPAPEPGPDFLGIITHINSKLQTKQNSFKQKLQHYFPELLWP